MEINYYRQPNVQGIDEAWDACQFTGETDLSVFRFKPLVTINGQPILRQHHITYLTGKETCRAHHFAKYLAIRVLEEYSNDDGRPRKPNPYRCKVLWIDTLHGPHISAAIYDEMAAHASSSLDLHFVCLDVLGGQRDDVWYVNRAIERLVHHCQPDLVVIDDIDHFMPHCGITIANEFCRAVRDFLNHTETAFLFIGYNHLSKKASTTGNLGKYLFIDADDVFTLNTQRDVTTVRHINGYDLSHLPENCEFRFSIGPDNLPCNAAPLHKGKASAIDDDTLCHIVNDILEPGEVVTPDELLEQVTARHKEIRQQDRTEALLNQALRLNLIAPVPHDGAVPAGGDDGDVSGSGTSETGGSDTGPARYIHTPAADDCSADGGDGSPRQVQRAAAQLLSYTPDDSNTDTDFNNSLTLPPLPQQPC